MRAGLGEQFVGFLRERRDRISSGGPTLRWGGCVCKLHQRVRELRRITALLAIHPFPRDDRFARRLSVVGDRGLWPFGRLVFEQLRAKEPGLTSIVWMPNGAVSRRCLVG